MLTGAATLLRYSRCENCGSDCFVDVLGFWSASVSTDYGVRTGRRLFLER